METIGTRSSNVGRPATPNAESRILAQVLKDRVPFDRVPFSCSKYQRLVEEVDRLGIPDTRIWHSYPNLST
ncbi:hypothetical protein DPMN_143618 [Dreissena polymorpha]|uniref:Uncharacterized protein n=1 Tax=Dreissena polymorpha TaxID=45954 RepID=A0A9D4GGP4_DREPO|nr:hypothetical protein DPMN_143618 [Dreissena polymorpha]